MNKTAAQKLIVKVAQYLNKRAAPTSPGTVAAQSGPNTTAVPQNYNNPGILSPEHVANMRRLEYNAITAPFENGNLVKHVISQRPWGAGAGIGYAIESRNRPQNQHIKPIVQGTGADALRQKKVRIGLEHLQMAKNPKKI